MTEQSPEAKLRLDRAMDLQAALVAGRGATRQDDQGQRFEQYLNLGDFKKSGLQDVAETLMANIRQLLERPDKTKNR